MDKLDFELLTQKIASLIEYQKSINPDIAALSPKHAPLFAQIISNYDLKKLVSDEKPKAEMIYLGAPTGAGKDTLVRKIMQENPDKDYVVLNMVMFRHYHDEIIGEDQSISDKDFAKKTNQTSYAIYYMIQEIILNEFPGTNVIVTGTMKDLEWVKEIVSRYKSAEKTNYSISLATLAVPINESAFSIFERYLHMVDTRDSSGSPLRYTDLAYHNDTTKEFISNVQFFEDDLHKNGLESYFDSIKVYKRHLNMFDLSEKTLIYDSTNPDPSRCATAHIRDIMYSTQAITPSRITGLLNLVKDNSDYLKSQGLYKDVLYGIEQTLPMFNRSNKDVEK